MNEDERIRLELDLGQSTAKTVEFSRALHTVAVTADQATVPALKQVDVAAENASHSSNQLGRGVLSASYAFQDFTSQINNGLLPAISAVQNNIPGILMGFGVGGGITAGISVVAVGAGLLYQNWDKLANLWKDGETEKEAERVKHLVEETEKATKAAAKEFEGLSKDQAAPGGDIQKAIKQFGGAKVHAAITKALINYQGDFGDEANKEFVNNLVANVNRGDPAALDMFKTMFGGQGDDMSRALTGRPSGRDTRAQSGEAEVEKLRAAANEKFAKDQAQRRIRVERNLDRRTDQDIRDEEDAAKKVKDDQAMIKTAVGRASREKNRALNENVSGQQRARNEGQRTLEQMGKLHQQFDRGLLSVEQYQAGLINLQQFSNQINQRLRQLEVNERKIQQNAAALRRAMP